MNGKTLAVIGVVVIVIVAAAAYFAFSGNDSPEDSDGSETLTVTDIYGNDVTVSLPVTKVVLGETSIIDTFAAVVGENWTDYVVMMPSDLETREPDKANLLYSQYPELRDLPKMPDFYSTGEFPVEEVAAVDPDLVLLPGATIAYMPGMSDQYQPLTDSGIGVMLIDFYSYGLTDTVAAANLDPLGEIMGCTDRSDRIVDWYNEKVDVVSSVVNQMPDSEKNVKVYYEVMSGTDPLVPGRVVAMGTPELDVLGAVNVADGAPNGVYPDGQWSDEMMAAANPDVIILVSTGYFGSDRLFGYGTDATDDELAAATAPYLERPGWQETDAMKDGNIFFTYGELRNGVQGVFDLYSVASIMYPEEFGDLDATATLMEYYEEFMPWSFEGVWSYLVA